MTKELRSVSGEVVAETRDVNATDVPKMVIKGTAAVFNSPTELYPGLFEQVDPAAFNEVMGQDIRALFNHDQNHVLGRSTAGTLRLNISETALEYEIELPDSHFGRDLYESIKRGDISQSSFAFTVEADKWEMRSDKTEMRTILKIGTLYEVSPVTFPAYADTSVALRSKPKVEEEKKPNQLYKLRLDLLNRLI